MSSEISVSTDCLGKAYHVYARPSDRFWQSFLGNRRKLYSEYWALKAVSLKIRRGEAVGIIGRNGSGKSTLLQLICGTVKATEGSVEVRGRVAALLELGAGFNPEFTGRENIYLAATVLGLTTNIISQRVDQIIEFASIGDFVDQPVKVYSSGMYARLAFAVAAHVDADVLIVDEILSVGDAAFGQKCMRFIHEFKRQGTLILVSHDSSAVQAICDRAIWLESGQVRAEGNVKEICDEYGRTLQLEGDDGHTLRFGGRRGQRLPERVMGEDARRDLLRASTLRNDIEVFSFDPDAAWWGQRKATIQNVTLSMVEGDPGGVLEGGERVCVEITCSIEQDLKQPIVGFFVRDRLGQNLFGDNSFLSYVDRNFSVVATSLLVARFLFQLPYLPSGDYSVCVAIADGTQEDNIQQHWVDDALFFRVHSSHVAKGILGIPMLKIELELVRN